MAYVAHEQSAALTQLRILFLQEEKTPHPPRGALLLIPNLSLPHLPTDMAARRQSNPGLHPLRAHLAQ